MTTATISSGQRPAREPQQKSQPLVEDSTRLGGYAYQIIRHQSKQVFKWRAEVLADTDVEALHQMRIGTRRLRAALLLFEDVISDGAPTQTQQNKSDQNIDSNIKKIAASVKQITKTLGKVRDIDVMKAWFDEALSNDDLAFNKSEKKTVKKLLKTLKKRRKKQFSKMTKVLKSSDYKKLKKRCKQWLKRPTFSEKAQQSAVSSAIEKIVEPVTELLRHPGWQIATEQNADKKQPIKNISLSQLNQQLAQEANQLHDLRKQIKQIRYQTEFFRGIYGITYAAQIREFRLLQKVLGQLQDQLVISEFLSQTLGEDWAEQLPTIHTAFQTSRLSLWQQWQPLQAKYLALRANLKEDIAA